MSRKTRFRTRIQVELRSFKLVNYDIEDTTDYIIKIFDNNKYYFHWHSFMWGVIIGTALMAIGTQVNL